MKIGTGVEFNFGGFHAKFDDKDNQLRLSDGCFADTLLFENSDFSMVVADATTLQANTLIVKRAVFKNEGVLETFIALLQKCPMVENKGKLHARNLFLHGTDIQNYGMVTYDDVFKAVGGKIIPKAANFDFHEKQGFFQHGASTGNTRILSLHKTYHGKTVVDKGRLQIKELTDGSFNIFNPFGSPWNYTAILVGHLDACGGMVVKSGTTLNFHPGSRFIANAPVVIGTNVTLNLGWSDNPSQGDCSFKDNTINIKSGSAANLNKPKGDHSKEGVWISPFNGQTPLFPDFDAAKTYQAHETEELTLYIIYGT